jgi:glycosyltransferase involved in cell wall biosynthesis
MPRHRILLQTNPCFLRTGLAENAKTLLRYLYSRPDLYEIAQMATQGTMTNDPRLNLTPWKSFGSIPPDQEIINRINSDPGFARNATYGSVNIDNVIKEWKPTIWIGSDDLWSFPLSDYAEKPWFQRINSIHHITVDSVPVLDQAFEQAKKSKVFLTWAKFAAKEMKRVGGASMNHVSSIYGAMDTGLFSPVSEQERQSYRARFNISPDTFVFLFVSRNQLRKQFPRCLEAFAMFKRDNPGVKAKLHFHTSFSEKGMGWDIEKLAKYHGLKADDILCTYVCKACGAWLIAPYTGEDINCPVCHAEKSMVTASIVHGVPGDQMKFVYGVADACLSIFTSGGQEYHNVQSLLCGKPVAITNYSCGEDFCTDETGPFVYPIRWKAYDEAGTNFIKAASDATEISRFMRKVVNTSKRDLAASAEKGREWAVKNFGIETIGAQWDKLFATLPSNLEWSSVDLTKAPPKNPEYRPASTITDNEAWLKDIYAGILNMHVQPNDEGLRHWMERLNAGITRDQILAFFVKTAHEENQKNGHSTAGAPVDFASLLEETGRPRGLIVAKESIGDICMITSLFPSFHRQHPNTDLYVMTDPKYAEILAGNEHVFKVLPYIPAAELELAMVGQGTGRALFSVYYHPCITVQRQLGYLSLPEPEFDVRTKQEAQS